MRSLSTLPPAGPLDHSGAMVSNSERARGEAFRGSQRFDQLGSWRGADGVSAGADAGSLQTAGNQMRTGRDIDWTVGIKAKDSKAVFHTSPELRASQSTPSMRPTTLERPATAGFDGSTYQLTASPGQGEGGGGGGSGGGGNEQMFERAMATYNPDASLRSLSFSASNASLPRSRYARALIQATQMQPLFPRCRVHSLSHLSYIPLIALQLHSFAIPTLYLVSPIALSRRLPCHLSQHSPLPLRREQRIQIELRVLASGHRLPPPHRGSLALRAHLLDHQSTV